MSEQAGHIESRPLEGESIHTMTTRSRHSSMHGPYREGAPDTNQFPLCHKVFSAYGSVESFSRSLLSLGHGYPIYNVLGDRKSRSSLHLNGPGFGDVGFLSTHGEFTFLFNIFAHIDDPIHLNETPPGFIPMEFPEPTEVIRRPNHFPPGTVLTSKAIEIHRVSASPLEFVMSTTVREGGVIVLPDGASREDLTPSPALFRYIEQHAMDWYLHAPSVLRGPYRIMSNGSLYVVTGCDKAQSASCVTVPSASEHSGEKMSIRYKQDKPAPWANEAETLRTCTYDAGANPGAWYDEHPDIRPYYNLLSTPITGRLSRAIRLFEEVFSPRDTVMDHRSQIPFHPADIIAQVILKDYDSEVVLIEDSVWTTHVDPVSGDGTFSEIIKLLVRTLLAHDVLPGKLTRLAPKPNPAPDRKLQGIVSRVPLKALYDRWQVEWKIKRVVNER